MTPNDVVQWAVRLFMIWIWAMSMTSAHKDGHRGTRLLIICIGLTILFLAGIFYTFTCMEVGNDQPW